MLVFVFYLTNFFFLKKNKCGSHDDTYELVRNHIMALKRVPFLRRAHILFAIERNMAHESGHIWHNIRNIENVHPICEKKEDIVGIYTSQFNKPKYAISAREHVIRGSITIAQNIVCANPRMKTESGSIIPAQDRPKFILDKLREQLLRYRQIESDTTDPISTTRMSVSGVADRHGKKDPSAKDDLAFTFTFCCGTTDALRQDKFKFVQKDWLP